MAVMSAANPQTRRDDGVYHFNMPQPIPSYLVALAVGELEFRSLGSSTGVYAEPEVIEKAAYEFAETEDMPAIIDGGGTTCWFSHPAFRQVEWRIQDCLSSRPLFWRGIALLRM
jgi:hypothetical protein